MSLLASTYETSAAISLDEKYRYELVCSVLTLGVSRSTLGWVMLNPSTADAIKDDPTIRKCLGFAHQLGYGRIQVVNLFAYRATKPSELRKAYESGENVVGEQNRAFIEKMRREVDMVICAWGNDAIFKKEPLRMLREGTLSLLRQEGRKIHHLGLTKDGNPKHPLYIEYSQRPIPFF